MLPFQLSKFYNYTHMCVCVSVVCLYMCYTDVFMYNFFDLQKVFVGEKGTL